MNGAKNRIFIVGATGLIGKPLVKILLEYEYYPVVISRNPQRAKELFDNKVDVELWSGEDINALSLLIDGAKAVVNLAGTSIATRWSKEKKESILNSRVRTTNAIVGAIRKCTNPPEVFIQASAIGYYPNNQVFQLDENGPTGNGFLSHVVMQWEQAAKKVENCSRLVIIRTGIVLSPNGGYLSSIMMPIKLYMGSWFGDGSQIVSWIHIKDHVRAILFLIENEKSKGIYNLVSNNPESSIHILKLIGKRIHRPVWLPIPTFLVKLIYGEMANEIILSNQSISPKRLSQEGFIFQFNSIENALKDLLDKID